MPRKSCALKFSPGACLLAVFWLLFLPAPWIFAIMAAALVHEASHGAAIWIFTGKIPPLRLSVMSANMELSEMNGWQELICALAGPLGSLCLIFLAEHGPRLAFCGLAQGLYNLLPIYPMDGGRALTCLCRQWLSPGRAQRVIRSVELGALLLLTGFGFWLALVCDFGAIALYLPAVLFFKWFSANIPCNRGKLGVQ